MTFFPVRRIQGLHSFPRILQFLLSEKERKIYRERERERGRALAVIAINVIKAGI
jgi:hypothetical protein